MSIIDLNTADIFNAIGGGSPLSIIDSVLHPQYVIRYNGTGYVALEYSGMSAIQPSGKAQITSAPVEGGKYQSINKVKDPSVVRCEIIVTGLTGFSGNIPNIFDLTFTSQSNVLRTIKVMLETTGIYDIETPKETLESYDLIDHSYEVSSRRGVSMLTIFLYFQEVMQQMEVSMSGAQSQGKPAKDDTSQGVTGMGSQMQKAASNQSNLDDLSKSWSSLRKSVGEISTTATEKITSGFTSALETVSKPAIDVASSATKKAAEITANISKTITGPSG